MFIMPEFDFKNITNISQETFKYHYGKHYKSYIDNLNKLSEKSSLDNLLEIINRSQGSLFNNAAQVWNHTFYWLCLTPESSNLESNSELKVQIEKQFGSFLNFRDQFIKEALNLFGSGWTWLALNIQSKQLEIINTSNAGVIDFNKFVPLLICDDWEHAYYIDFRNSRNKYLEAFWNSINWEFVDQNYKNKKIIDINDLLHFKPSNYTRTEQPEMYN